MSNFLETAKHRLKELKADFPSINTMLCEVPNDASVSYHFHVVNAPIHMIDKIKDRLEDIKSISYFFTKSTVSPTCIVMHPEDIIGFNYYSN